MESIVSDSCEITQDSVEPEPLTSGEEDFKEMYQSTLNEGGGGGSTAISKIT